MISLRKSIPGFTAWNPEADLEAVSSHLAEAKKAMRELTDHAQHCKAEYCGQCDNYIYLAQLIDKAATDGN